MKKVLVVVILFAVLASGCMAAVPDKLVGNENLVVSDGMTEKTYSVDTLKTLPATQAAFKDVNYRGVKIVDLLVDAGFDPQTVKAVKGIASDGFSVNYDPSLFQRDDVIVAYQTENGALAPEDGSFRMVLPGEEGKLNVRMLVKIQVTR